MPTPFAPLLDTDVPYQPTPQLYTPRDTPAPVVDVANTRQVKQQMNSVIPPELSSVESRLKAEGSGTSTLSTITAWLGAAKGDFRGLQAIEDSKKRTALAKTMVPEITKVNKMINSGKWDEASDYVNELASSYGTRAEYLVPYFQQMQANIQKKQEGYNQLTALVSIAEESGAADPSHPNHAAWKALSRVKTDKTPMTETALLNFMTRAQPHTQNIDGTVYITNPLTGKTTKDVQTQVYKDKDFDSYTGVKTASAGGITIQSLADLFNDKEVKREDGTVISPNSKEAQLVKAHYINQQPIEARLKLMQTVKFEPALTAQLVAQGTPIEDIALGSFGAGGNKMEAALQGQSGRLAAQTAAVNEATNATDPRVIAQTGMVPFDTRTNRAVEDPTTIADIRGSGGKIILLSKETLNNRVIPVQAELENLAQIPKILEGISGPQTRGETLGQGVEQTISRYTGIALSDAVKKMQQARTLLNRSAEKLYNIAEMSGGIAGKDSKDMATLKQFMTGTFNTPQEYLKAAKMIEEGYQRELKRAIGGEKSAVEQLAPAVNKANKNLPKGQRQVTNESVYENGKIQIPEGLDPELTKRILATGKAAVATGKPTGGSMRVETPTPSVPTPVAPNTAAPTTTTPQYNEEDEVRKAMQQKKQQRGVR